MKRGALILLTVLSSGLLLFSQAMATGKSMQHEEAQSGAVQIGEQAGQMMPDPQLNVEQLKEVQQILSDKGYEIGNIDGVIGEDTMAAIRQFQDSSGLEPTGMPNQDTLRALAPDSDQQEFFGLSPEFGETSDKMLKTPPMPETKSY